MIPVKEMLNLRSKCLELNKMNVVVPSMVLAI